jgi:RimJ/RimL family protein N-acetyltransferase
MERGYQAEVEEEFRRLKRSPGERVAAAGPSGWLVPVTREDLDDAAAITRLARWREAGAHGFPSQFTVTEEGTKRWLQKGLLEVPDRLLFWVEVPGLGPVGHVGLFRLDAGRRALEIDNIVRGEPGLPGLMHDAVSALIDWSFGALGVRALYLRVFSDNERAIRLYERCGFEETMRVPVARVEEPGCVRWVEVGGEYREKVTRYFVTMVLPAARRAGLAAA